MASNRVRCVVVGQNGAGKSTLLHHLRGVKDFKWRTEEEDCELVKGRETIGSSGSCYLFAQQAFSADSFLRYLMAKYCKLIEKAVVPEQNELLLEEESIYSIVLLLRAGRRCGLIPWFDADLVERMVVGYLTLNPKLISPELLIYVKTPGHMCYHNLSVDKSIPMPYNFVMALEYVYLEWAMDRFVPLQPRRIHICHTDSFDIMVQVSVISLLLSSVEKDLWYV